MDATRPDPDGMTREEFATLGVQGVAYVRVAPDARAAEGEEGPAIAFTIHSADGERIGAAPSRDLAFAAIRQHGLEPVDAH